LVHPVGVENTQVAGTSTNALLSHRSQGTLELELSHTLTGGLAVGETLGSLSLAGASANADSGDKVSYIEITIV